MSLYFCATPCSLLEVVLKHAYSFEMKCKIAFKEVIKGSTKKGKVKWFCADMNRLEVFSIRNVESRPRMSICTLLKL